MAQRSLPRKRVFKKLKGAECICGPACPAVLKVSTWILGQRTTVTAVLIVMKCTTCAYGTQLGRDQPRYPHTTWTGVK